MGDDERSAITRRAGLVAAGTLSSRVLGMVRDAVIAATFAVSATDAFWLAFTIPNALRGLLGEGAVSGAFVPVLTDVRHHEGEDAARQFYARLSGVMIAILVVISVAGVLAAPWLVQMYASGFADDPELFQTTVDLTRVVFPYIALMGIAALLTGALHASRRFAAPAFAPIGLNVALIGAALALPPVVERWGMPGVMALAFGALFGGLIHIALQLPEARRVGMLGLPSWKRDPRVRRAMLLLVPLLVGLGVYQLNVIASRQLASYLPRGSISWLFYGQRLVEIPQGMFALAIGSAALPTLAQMQSRGEIDEAKKVFRFGLRLILFVAIPASVALVLLAEPTVAAVFGRGRFDATSIQQTAYSLVFLASGVWAVAAVRTIVPMFHALGDTRTPVVASAVNLIVFFGVGLATMGPLRHAGLALGITAAACVQLVVLLLLLRRKVGALGLRSVVTSMARSVIAAALMGAVLWGAQRVIAFDGGGTLRNVGVFLGLVIAGAITYLASAAILRSPELGELRAALRRRRG